MKVMTTFLMEQAMLEAFTKQAAKQQTTRSQLLRQLISEYLASVTSDVQVAVVSTSGNDK
jgi:hypothetical protein